jgi:2-polyprenyl-3-methyl-5-hydroxy-6-metoxy-1,4-benzoquinol methylase
MRYDAQLDPDDDNTSHALVLELVGTGKRVLDVGCATGYLAEALGSRGNKVSGVEIDAAAAEEARPYLERLVVGDLERIDLGVELAGERFDVVVFADVLEHLRDPVATLRQAKAILGEGGYVVLSIPNIAHGSVRFALLEGQFQYRSLGLLDGTHLRFFTRESLEELLSEAGFVAVDVRRTTASPFQTEIPLSPSDFPDDVITRVAADPDSTTYQFVLTATPQSPAGLTEAETLASMDRELGLLRGHLAQISRHLSTVAPRPAIGVVDTHPPGELPALASIRTSVIVAELRRRLDGIEVRACSLTSEAGTGVDGEPVYPLLAGPGQSASPTLSELEGLVASPGGLSARLAEMAGARLPSELTEHAFGDGRTSEPADALAVVDRSFTEDFLALRGLYLRVVGSVPASGGLVVGHLVGDTTGGSISEPLAALARQVDSEPMVIPRDIAPVDLVALVGAADLVVTDSPSLAALAAGLRRSVIVVSDGGDSLRWAQDAGMASGGSVDVVSLAGDVDARNTEEIRDYLIQKADLSFDALVGPLITTTGRGLARTMGLRLAQLAGRVDVLESVNEGLRRNLLRERMALANGLGLPDSLANRPSQRGSFKGPSMHPRTASEAEIQIGQLQDEIDRIYATRLFRYAKPLRDVYGRMRSLRP